MKRMSLRCALSVSLLALCLSSAFALSSKLVSDETTVVLRPDGKATVSCRLEWKADGGQMHGFYYEGEAFSPVWDMEHCWADLPDTSRSALSIKDLGDGKYDVVLALGKGFSGTAYYNLSYAGDFAAAQLIGNTTTASGEKLIYFDWGPVWWDQSLEYRSVRLVLPKTVGSDKLSDEEKAAIPLRTEKAVNAENKIDWYGTKGEDGKFYLTGLFYQKDVQVQGTQRLQLYFPAGYLDLSAELSEVEGKTAVSDEAEQAQAEGAALAAASASANAEEKPRDYFAENVRGNPILSLSILVALIALALVLYARRLASYRARKALLAGISWAGDAWSPPRILVGSYQVPGKVAEGLHPVEVALLMELPLPRVAAIMIEGLRRQGLIELVSESPLRIKILSAAKAQSDYEESFLGAFDSEGRVLSGLMADFFEAAIKKLQEKVWDCDLEATKTYYRKKIEEAE